MPGINKKLTKPCYTLLEQSKNELMIIKVFVWAETGGSRHEETIEVEVQDNATEEEKDEIAMQEAKEWLFNRISYGYECLE